MSTHGWMVGTMGEEEKEWRLRKSNSEGPFTLFPMFINNVAMNNSLSGDYSQCFQLLQTILQLRALDIQKRKKRDFSGGPEAKISSSQCRRSRFPGQGTRAHMLQLRVGMLQKMDPTCHNEKILPATTKIQCGQRY